ncbi:hypothetical protein BD779DRAFT_1674333 [Infundibulicybe gibba]|nr:hypothetical protein BD779DRAFT_1674333 [Infundibulicybe gibba]
MILSNSAFVGEASGTLPSGSYTDRWGRKLGHNPAYAMPGITISIGEMALRIPKVLGVLGPFATEIGEKQKSDGLHNGSQKTFHQGTVFKELFGHSDGDGLTCGILTMTDQGDPEIAIDCRDGFVGIITKGVLFLIDSGAPDDRHEFREGQIFHVTKGSTFKWGAGSNGEAFYAVAKPIDRDDSQSLKRPVF